jgi:protoporphyrinogen oxidase
VNPRRVAVIGGGLAGIAAALDCSRAGASVTLLESRGRLGGAAYSFTREGIPADNGQHVFLRCCTAYLELLSELDASEMVTLQPRGAGAQRCAAPRCPRRCTSPARSPTMAFCRPRSG